MKKLLLVGLLLSMSTGCGRGWLPCLYRGAPCNGNCIGAAPALPHCEHCGVGAGYATYDGEVYGGEIVSDGPVVGSSNTGVLNTPPAMSNIPAR